MYPKHKIWVVFQPHMYSRLQNLFDDFIKALSMANKVVVTDVYSKREPGVNKPSGKELALAIGAPKATYVGGDLLNVANFVSRNSTKGDVILNMGAGDVYKVSDILLEWR
jgi:UDP-N-acetylmuramate--alanine ligase